MGVGETWVYIDSLLFLPCSPLAPQVGTQDDLSSAGHFSGSDNNHYCCCLVTMSCPALCDPVDCSTPGFPVLHHLREFAQTHVH